MAKPRVRDFVDKSQMRVFVKSLLQDVRALGEMLENGMIESGIRRIGAEQEVFLVNKFWHPALSAQEVLKEVGDPHFTTELGLFNLEINLDPLPFDCHCLRRLEESLKKYLEQLRTAANRLDTEVVLTGILPTLSKCDLTLDNITPQNRYYALNEAVNRLRGGPQRLHIKGIDELIIIDDSVMLESCNTSFQLHFQVGPEEFAQLHNIAQLVTAPILAATTNSPLLFGKRLWRETRLALFQQAIDTRRPTSHPRESRPRVGFGTAWVKESVLEIFKEDIARFRVLLGTRSKEDPFELIRQGKPPSLASLCVFGGTVYRWNRPCYGICNGKAHLRIENRVLPAGPTILDEVANAAFYYGLMAGISTQHKDITTQISFEKVKSNFLAAARLGLGAQLAWLGQKTLPARELICRELLPLARQGLLMRGIDSGDVDRYLSVIEERVDSGQTPSQWMLNSLVAMRGRRPRAERLAALVAAMAHRQKKGAPVHTWKLAQLKEAGGWKPNYMRVEQYMTSDLFTVSQEDTVELVACIMDWQHIRHVPVEDNCNRLIGLVSYRSVIRFFSQHPEEGRTAPVSQIMKKDPLTVAPETPTLKALEIIRLQGVGCLPVVKDKCLVGIVTERDFIGVSSQLLEQKLRD
ncbi:MAG: glutamate-cysteine ligase family protein [Acidobacteriota bacterium]